MSKGRPRRSGDDSALSGLDIPHVRAGKEVGAPVDAAVGARGTLVGDQASWSLRSFGGVARLTPISRPLTRRVAPRTRAPSLPAGYGVRQVQAVLCAPPTPVAASC